MTSNTDIDDLPIYRGLIYRSMRHVTLNVIITTIIDVLLAM